MRELHPEQYTARMQDKLNYRYPGVGGESCAPHGARGRLLLVRGRLQLVRRRLQLVRAGLRPE